MNALVGSHLWRSKKEERGLANWDWFDVADIYGLMPAFDEDTQEVIVQLLDDADARIAEAASLVATARRIVGITI